MRTSVSIALAVVVLSIGATPAGAVQLLGRDCTGGRGSSPFDPIECRLLGLLQTTNASAAELGDLWSPLNNASGNAGDRAAGAQGICSFGKTSLARQRLRRVKMLLDRYVARLRSPAAEGLRPELRDPLLTEAVAVAAEVVALRGRVHCPIDA